MRSLLRALLYSSECPNSVGHETEPRKEKENSTRLHLGMELALSTEIGLRAVIHSDQTAQQQEGAGDDSKLGVGVGGSIRVDFCACACAYHLLPPLASKVGGASPLRLCL